LFHAAFVESDLWGKGGGTKKMFPHEILLETPPPTLEPNRQACSQSLDVNGGDRSLSGYIYQQQYLCQIIIIVKFSIESYRYSGGQGIGKHLRSEKKSLIL
jgi:hypothetical protein